MDEFVCLRIFPEGLSRGLSHNKASLRLGLCRYELESPLGDSKERNLCTYRENCES